MKPIKLLYDIEQILNAGGKNTGLGRVESEMLKVLSSCPEYEIYPLVTRKTKYTAEQYLSANGLEKLIGNIVYMPHLRRTCSSYSVIKNIQAFFYKIVYGKRYSNIINQYDEYISVYAPISPLVYKSKLKTRIVVHDLISIVHPELCPEGSNLKKYAMQMKDIKSDEVICISKSTYNDFIKFRSDFDKNKIKIVYWGIDNRFHPVKSADIPLKYGINTKNYVLTVSEVNKRKNLVHLLDAFAEFYHKSRDKDISLVIVGPKKKNYDAVTSQIDALKDIKDKVVLTGFVDDEDLPALYSQAEIFVFPSLYEGFGMPVLEAMACGTPVIASNNSSLPEVGGDGSLYIGGHDVEETAKQIAKLHNDPQKRAEMSKIGLERAKNIFVWSRVIKQIFDL